MSRRPSSIRVDSPLHPQRFVVRSTPEGRFEVYDRYMMKVCSDAFDTETQRLEVAAMKAQNAQENAKLPLAITVEAIRQARAKIASGELRDRLPLVAGMTWCFLCDRRLPATPGVRRNRNEVH
jgi:hypothetical protein